METFESLNFSITFNLIMFDQILDFEQLNVFDILGGPDQVKVGNLEVERCSDMVDPSKHLKHLSQTIPSSGKRQNVNPVIAQRNSKAVKSDRQSVHALVQKDVGKIFKDLNLVPSVASPSDDLQCALCTHRASHKNNLKTHYKLKHLGGADLAMSCSICQKKCTTKSNLEKHMIVVHKLSREDAIRLTV